MQINRFVTKYMLSNTYLVTENGHGIIIDPCEMDEVKTIIDKEVLCLDYAILTHEHYDHISGLDWVHSLEIPVIASGKCDDNLRDTRINQSRYYDSFCKLQVRLKDCEPVHVEEYRGYADILFQGRLRIRWQGHELVFTETPGHSDGGICVEIDDQYLFSGDTLLGDTFTGTNMAGGSEEKFQSISWPWLQTLDRNIIVYSGHGEEFHLGTRMDTKYEKPRRKRE